MALSYLDAVTQGFPAVMAHAEGSPFIYDNIIWSGGDALPSQDELDAWIASENIILSNSVTKYQFRQLFTTAERVAIDNAGANTAIPANYRAMLVTIMKDLELSQTVILTNPAVAQGVGFLETLGLIAAGRAARILANQPPV
jgi:hypothetical protein